MVTTKVYHLQNNINVDECVTVDNSKGDGGHISLNPEGEKNIECFIHESARLAQLTCEHKGRGVLTISSEIPEDTVSPSSTAELRTFVSSMNVSAPRAMLMIAGLAQLIANNSFITVEHTHEPDDYKDCATCADMRNAASFIVAIATRELSTDVLGYALDAVKRAHTRLSPLFDNDDDDGGGGDDTTPINRVLN